ncbi:MAG: shikimate kinase [Tannerellaceae bacterium]|nr:shikimate kinase [Tannerellaceae bacterium]
MKRIFLVGYMGVGKTTIGQVLAQRIVFSFIDLDKYIEGRYGMTISLLFKEKGEEAFREIERQMLLEVSSFEDVVISTGGGTPCYHSNMENMKKTGITIYLRASTEELARRIETSCNIRPILAGRRGEELREFIRNSLQQREMFYNQASLAWNVPSLETNADIQQVASSLADELHRTVEK